MAKIGVGFKEGCKIAGIPETTRQQRKWDRGTGIAFRAAHGALRKNERIQILAATGRDPVEVYNAYGDRNE
jgi:hypothetical protein